MSIKEVIDGHLLKEEIRLQKMRGGAKQAVISRRVII